MKKITVFLWCSVFLCSIMTHAQSSEIPTHLVIEKYDGESISILLSDKPKITFYYFHPYDDYYKEHILQIATLKESYEFYTERINKISYKSETSGADVNTLISDVVEQHGDQLYFSTNKPNTHISVIDIKGNILMAETIDSGNYFFSLTDLLPGTYIAKINNTTIKFIKQ